jgi:uncharacterized membrane protein YhaH (DUF805 family)
METVYQRYGTTVSKAKSAESHQMTVEQVLSDFEGRIGRTTWWAVQLVVLTISGCVVLALKSVVGLWCLVLLLPACFIIVATNTKRLHDRSKSGWWQVVGLVGGLCLASWKLYGGSDEGTDAIALLAGIVLCLWIALEIGVWPGDDGINEHGARVQVQFGLHGENAIDEPLAASALALNEAAPLEPYPALDQAAPIDAVEHRVAERRQGFGRRKEGLPDRRVLPLDFGRRAQT